MDEPVKEYKLNVPAQPLRRIVLINAARETVAASGLLPPVSLDVLESLAARVVESTGGTNDELAFAILMCSNELWRPCFEATRYDRRLLLLPQCLRDKQACTVVIDSLGLVCAGCDSCPIHSTLKEAETLGYSTLVAEGSSTAIALVEEGSVDAILGVSCMDVLQKSFNQVVSSAIPSLAVPLLHDGCADTAVDQQWLLNEIRAMTPDENLEPLSVSLLKNQAEALFTREFLSAQFDLVSTGSLTGKLAVESMLQGGKRMRPLLTLVSCTAYSRLLNPSIADQLMLAVECFHKASLIHDDIEDGDDYRYDRKTMHIENGIPLAVNLGDYLIGMGYRKLSLLPLPSRLKLQLLDLFSSMHIESTLGQGEDLAVAGDQAVHDVRKTLAIFRQKTGSAIQVSLLAGAIAADAPDTDRAILSEFAALYGIAYQIRDDLNEFRCTATDQKSASFPFLKSILIEKKGVTGTNHEEWKELIGKYGADLAACEKLDETLTRMTLVLKGLRSYKARLALLNIVNRFIESK